MKPAEVVDREVDETSSTFREVTTLDTGDVFTSVLDKSSNILADYYNGVYVNQFDLDEVYVEMVTAQMDGKTVLPYNWRCNTIEWLALGNTAVWGIVAAMFPPNVVAAVVAGTITDGALLAARQACLAGHG